MISVPTCATVETSEKVVKHGELASPLDSQAGRTASHLQRPKTLPSTEPCIRPSFKAWSASSSIGGAESTIEFSSSSSSGGTYELRHHVQVCTCVCIRTDMEDDPSFYRGHTPESGSCVVRLWLSRKRTIDLRTGEGGSGSPVCRHAQKCVTQCTRQPVDEPRPFGI